MMSKRFYIPTVFFNSSNQEHLAITTSNWKRWSSLVKREKLDDQLSHSRSDVHRTDFSTIFAKALLEQGLSLSDFNGTEVLVEGSFKISVDGSKASVFPVNGQVELQGKDSSQLVDQEVELKKISTSWQSTDLTSNNVGAGLSMVEHAAKLFKITNTTNLEDAAKVVATIAEELNLYRVIKEASPKFRNAFDLMVMGMEGQFGKMPQGTKHNVNDPNRDTITKTIYQSHEDYSATDSHFIAKMVSEVRKNKKLK